MIWSKLVPLGKFQSTPPARGATTSLFTKNKNQTFQSTPPARGAPVAIGNRRHLHLGISIHAPREGGDFARELKGQRYIFISIHAPREGGDLGVLGYAANSDLFQSTPPARGATKSIQGCRCFLSDFNPRPPRGGRRDDPAGRLGDVVFQSTPPARGATYRAITAEYDPIISIHAPCEGGDIRMLDDDAWKP